MEYCVDDSVTDFLGSAALLNISFFELPARRPIKPRKRWGMVNLEEIQFLRPVLGGVPDEEDFDAPLVPATGDDDELDDDDEFADDDDDDDDDEEDDDDEFGADLDDDDEDDEDELEDEDSEV